MSTEYVPTVVVSGDKTIPYWWERHSLPHQYRADTVRPFDKAMWANRRLPDHRYGARPVIRHTPRRRTLWPALVLAAGCAALAFLAGRMSR